MNLSLVVLAWNNLDLTRRSVDSLREGTDVPYELVIVDNGSNDGTADYARSVADVAVINETNLGFAAGMNSGLRRTTGEFVAFINNDTSFPQAWASKIIETFKDFPTAGIVVPAVTAAGNAVTVRTHPGSDRVVLTPFGELPSGVVYVIRREIITALGGWNEDYLEASAEDLDLAFTVWAHGLDIVLDETVLVDHESQASVRNLPNRKELYRSNLEQFLTRWESAPFDGAPLAGSLTTEEFEANLQRARTAVIWIRRMLTARDEARELRQQIKAPAPTRTGRGWFRSRS